MRVSHGPTDLRVRFDEPNLIGSAGLAAASRLMESIGFDGLVADRVRIKGVANADVKTSSLVLGMIAGADSIDDMDVLRHGAMGKVFTGVRAPSTLGTFLRSFTFGHVRQLDSAAAAATAGLIAGVPGLLAGLDSSCIIDIDDTVSPVYGVKKQGAEHGYSGFRGLNALVAAVSTPGCAPVILGARLRRGAAHSSRGAAKLLADSLAAARRAGATGKILVRADSAFCNRPVITAITRTGARFSITARLDRSVQRSIGAIPAGGWTRIAYSQAIPDPDTGELVSAAEVAETVHTMGSGKGATITARLIVRRVPERNKTKIAAAQAEQGELFTVYRYHAVFTDNPMELIEAEAVHRQHAIIEQVFADLKDSALAHLPSATFTANAAWLTCAVLAANITRALGTLAGKDHARQRTGTIRRRIINIPARAATSARKLTLHLPTRWPWHTSWEQLWKALAPT